jgi:hypothetical protein
MGNHEGRRATKQNQSSLARDVPAPLQVTAARRSADGNFPTPTNGNERRSLSQSKPRWPALSRSTKGNHNPSPRDRPAEETAACLISPPRDGGAFRVVEAEPYRGVRENAVIPALPQARRSSAAGSRGCTAEMPSQRGRSRNGTGQVTGRHTMIAGRLLSRALPQSLGATKLSIVPLSNTPANW